MSVLEANRVRCDKLYPIGGIPANFIDLSNDTFKTFGGGIIQMSNTIYTQPTSLVITSNTYTQLPFSCSIIPKSSTNRLLIYVRFAGEVVQPYNTTFALSRYDTVINNFGLTILGAPSNSGLRNAGAAPAIISYANSNQNNLSTPEQSQFWVYDEALITSQITYTPIVRSFAAQTMAINKTITDSNAVGYERLISQITILEISSGP